MSNTEFHEKLIDKPEGLNAREALYGFAAWLTAHGCRTVMTSSVDASPIADLVDAFCRENGLEPLKRP